MEELTEEERRALRGSKFAPLPPSAPVPSRSNPRLAHPGGPLKTNKAAALAKFLERKLQDPNGLASINPDLIEQAVKNAKETIKGGTSNTGRVVQHVSSFGDPEVSLDEEKPKKCDSKKINKKKKNFKKKGKRQKANISGLREIREECGFIFISPSIYTHLLQKSVLFMKIGAKFNFIGLDIKCLINLENAIVKVELAFWKNK